MAMPAFYHVHHSGLWDASAAHWGVAVARACRAASVVSLTETTVFKPSGPKGWHAYHGESRPGANEATILWDGDVWEAVGRGFAVPLSKTPFALGKGTIRPRVHAIGQVLRHRTSGRVVVFLVVHTPSAVEGAGRLVAGARRANAYRETLAGLSRLRRSLRKAHPDAAFVISGDWNLNLRLRWAKALLRTAMPGVRSSWRRMPKDGTHGPRVIDDARHTRRLTTRGSILLPRVPTFDHTPVLTLFRFGKARR